MKKKILILCVCVWPFMARSQSIGPDVIATAGDHFTNAGGQLSYTLGELMIATASSGQHIITEGFHQPDLLITSVLNLEPAITTEIYPNPASSFFTINILGAAGMFNMLLFDTQGKLLTQQQLSGGSPETIEVGALPAGMYFVRITDASGKLLKTCKLIRSN